MKKGIQLVRAGVCLGDIGHAIQTLAEQNNCSVVENIAATVLARNFMKTANCTLRQTQHWF